MEKCMGLCGKFPTGGSVLLILDVNFGQRPVFVFLLVHPNPLQQRFESN